MRPCILSLLGLILFFSATGKGQEIKTIYLEPEAFIQTNFDPISFDGRQKEIALLMTDFFREDSIGRTIEVIQLYHKTSPTTYSVSILNAPEDSVLRAFNKQLNKLESITPVFTDYAIGTHYFLNGGNQNRKAVYYPQHTNWKKKSFRTFE